MKVNTLIMQVTATASGLGDQQQTAIGGLLWNPLRHRGLGNKEESIFHQQGSH